MISSLIDFSTYFPEAVFLKDVTSISTAEILLTIFSTVGIPRETVHVSNDGQTAQGSQSEAALHYTVPSEWEWKNRTFPLYTRGITPEAVLWQGSRLNGDRNHSFFRPHDSRV